MNGRLVAKLRTMTEAAVTALLIALIIGCVAAAIYGLVSALQGWTMIFILPAL